MESPSHQVPTETAKEANGVGDVRTSHGGKVEDGTKDAEVGDAAHELNLFLGDRTHGLGELDPRRERGAYRAAGLKTVTSKDVDDVLALGEGDGPVGAITPCGGLALAGIGLGWVGMPIQYTDLLVPQGLSLSVCWLGVKPQAPGVSKLSNFTSHKCCST